MHYYQEKGHLPSISLYYIYYSVQVKFLYPYIITHDQVQEKVILHACLKCVMYIRRL